MREECEEDLKRCKQKVIYDSNKRIRSLEKELKISVKLLKSLSEINTNEKVLMQELYKRNLQDKEHLLLSMSTRLDDMLSIFQAFKTPVSKGQFGEKYLHSFLQKQFPTAEIRDTMHTPHFGDIIVYMNGINVMFEMKNKNTITREYIKKFENDIDLHKHEFHGAIFLSSTHGIPNKGEFVFEWYGTTPVMYISQFIESPVLLNVSLNILFDFIPILQQNNDSIEHDNMIQTLTSVIATVSVLCDTLKQNCKTLGVVAHNVLEQKKKNEEKIQSCLHEITFLTEKYKLKIKNNLKHIPSQEELFQMILEERKKITGKYVYKTIVNATMQKNSLKGVSYEQINRVLPKAKFEEMCNDL